MFVKMGLCIVDVELITDDKIAEGFSGDGSDE